jgi:hypothetical protein
VDYPDLVSDFAGFLLPEQAVECGCSMAAHSLSLVIVQKLKLMSELAKDNGQKLTLMTLA